MVYVLEMVAFLTVAVAETSHGGHGLHEVGITCFVPSVAGVYA